jgi:hypothetical protein
MQIEESRGVFIAPILDIKPGAADGEELAAIGDLIGAGTSSDDREGGGPIEEMATR